MHPMGICTKGLKSKAMCLPPAVVFNLHREMWHEDQHLTCRLLLTVHTTHGLVMKDLTTYNPTYMFALITP